MGTEFSNPNAFNHNQLRPTKNTKSKTQTLRIKKQQTASNQNTWKQSETTKSISSKKQNQAIENNQTKQQATKTQEWKNLNATTKKPNIKA